MNINKKYRDQKVHEVKINIILNAALDLLARKSFFEIRIEDIGDSAGFSKPALYNYFKNKDELFLSLLCREYEKIMRALAHKTNKADHFFINIRNVIFGILNECEKHKTTGILSVQAHIQAMNHQDALPQRNEPHLLFHDSFAAFIEEIVSWAFERRFIPEHIPKNTAVIFCLAVIKGYVIQNCYSNYSLVSERAADELAEFICRGMGVRLSETITQTSCANTRAAERG